MHIGGKNGGEQRDNKDRLSHKRLFSRFLSLNG
jgi:hypothetical protein